jgi:hypothetical protein
MDGARGPLPTAVSRNGKPVDMHRPPLHRSISSSLLNGSALPPQGQSRCPLGPGEAWQRRLLMRPAPPATAVRWTAAGMMEAAKGFRRLKAHKQLPILRTALAAHQAKHATDPHLEQQAKAA